MKAIRGCKASIRLDLDAVIAARDAAFPVSMPEGRSNAGAVDQRRAAVRPAG
jgi:hypothetical protein